MRLLQNLFSNEEKFYHDYFDDVYTKFFCLLLNILYLFIFRFDVIFNFFLQKKYLNIKFLTVKFNKF